MNTRTPILELKALEKVFGGFTAVKRIDLQIAEGEFFTIVGPSGRPERAVTKSSGVVAAAPLGTGTPYFSKSALA